MVFSLKKKVTRIIVAFSVLCLMLMAIPMWNADTAQATGSTNVVPAGYIPIYTVDDLYAINNDLEADYILMNDLDLSEATAPGGKYDFNGNGWMPIGSRNSYASGAYKGTFNGNCHTITGLRIDIQNWPEEVYQRAEIEECGTAIYVGLFASIKYGNVDYLTIKDSYISISDSLSHDWPFSIYVGTICAQNSSGSIYQCHNYANVSVNSSIIESYGSVAEVVGGVAGRNTGSVNECSNAGDISLKKIKQGSGSYTGMSYAGGVCGNNLGSMIDDSYNCGKVTAEPIDETKSLTCATGISFGGYIKNCYNAGDIKCTGGATYGIGADKTANYCYTLASTEKYTGAIASSSTAKLSNCYFQAGHDDAVTGSYSLSETKLTDSGSYIGFDFREKWFIDAESGYPYPQLTDNPHDDGKAAPGTDVPGGEDPGTDAPGGEEPGKDPGDGNETDIVPDEKEIVINGISVTLKEAIGLNFYIGVPRAKGSYTASFTRDGKTTQIDLDAAEQVVVGEESMYKLEFLLNAKEINDEITISIADTEGYSYSFVSSTGTSYGKDYTMSVSRYLETLKDSDEEKNATMAKALLDYGNAAQDYFGYKPETAGAVSSSIDAVTVSSFDDSGYSKTGKIPDFDYYGSSLILESKVTIRHYFEGVNPEDLANYEIKVNGKVVEMKSAKGLYYIDITNIKPTELGDYYALEILKDGVSVFTLEYSTETYSVRVVKKPGNEKLLTLVKALHLYKAAADAFKS